jgi:putative transposase
MWTPADRALVGDFGAGQALTDDQFRLLQPLIPPAKPGGRPRTTDIRKLLDGLFYLVRTGCQWRHLPPPPAFPPWRTVYGYVRAFLRDGVWESIRHHFVVMLRAGTGREASPTAAIVDTQSVKTPESGGPHGWDAAKRLKGRKRHVAVDTDGLLLGILVHAADIQDADGLGDLLKRLKPLTWASLRQGRDDRLTTAFPADISEQCPGLSPSLSWPCRTRTTSHSVGAHSSRTIIPHAAGRAQEARPFSEVGC